MTLDISGVANIRRMFCPGCQKMWWDVLSQDGLSFILSVSVWTIHSVLLTRWYLINVLYEWSPTLTLICLLLFLLFKIINLLPQSLTKYMTQIWCFAFSWFKEVGNLSLTTLSHMKQLTPISKRLHFKLLHIHFNWTSLACVTYKWTLFNIHSKLLFCIRFQDINLSCNPSAALFKYASLYKVLVYILKQWLINAFVFN